MSRHDKTIVTKYGRSVGPYYWENLEKSGMTEEQYEKMMLADDKIRAEEREFYAAEEKLRETFLGASLLGGANLVSNLRRNWKDYLSGVALILFLIILSQCGFTFGRF